MYEGRLVRLRAYEPEDVDTLYDRFNDPRVIAQLRMRYPASRRQECDFVDSSGRLTYGAAAFAVEAIEDGRLLGGVGLLGAEPENRVAEMGIAISDASVWDRGYGTDAVRTVCRFGFEEMDLHRIGLEVHEGNERARHVYAKVGFVQEGTARQVFYKGGRRWDMHLMGLLRHELRLDG